jgi:hypothetical protein
MGSIAIKIFNYIPHVLSAIWVVVQYLISKYIFRVPVSYPPGPRSKPLLRQGKWLKNDKQLRASWKFCCDKKSHDITEKQYPGQKLSGESAGRASKKYILK